MKCHSLVHPKRAAALNDLLHDLLPLVRGSKQGWNDLLRAKGRKLAGDKEEDVAKECERAVCHELGDTKWRVCLMIINISI